MDGGRLVVSLGTGWCMDGGRLVVSLGTGWCMDGGRLVVNGAGEEVHQL